MTREEGNNLRSPKEFVFTTSDFRRIRELIYKRAGISLADSKEEMVYSRIARRLRATGISNFGAYLDRLESGAMEDEWEAFTNALTTNLTSFFREEHHFPILAEHVKKKKGSGTFSVWCSASSTGEEPYSIAITLCEALGTLHPSAEIVATDIDTNVLKTASHGVYAKDKTNKLSPERLRKFFLRGKGVNEGRIRVRKELRELITYHQLNLLESRWPVSGQFDVIFCRNVMIYFDKPTQGQILSRFAALLKPDGLLFAGHSENFSYVTDAFRLVGKTVYKLVSSRPETARSN
ncbi:MAG: chemotaxis protein CheR [Burkholderiaceae bacterium]|jgi:chemotaxis protein methyltransferase CheR|nr:chemotaxis protein CheR [Burkholderiaceae bacterium]